MEQGLGECGWGNDRPAQRNIDQAATGRRLRRDLRLFAGKQDQQATLGAGMLDRDPHEPLNELVEDDLARQRQCGLEYRRDIQLLDWPTKGSGRGSRGRRVAEMRMKLFELPGFAFRSPT